jgi:glucokinase
MDWGGTWVRAAVVDRQGEFLWQSRQPNPQGGTKEDYLKTANDLLKVAIGEASGGVAGIGVAAAGPVEASTGTLHQPPNLQVLNGVSLKSLWEPTFSCPVWVGNDANLAALGEFHFGAGKDSANQGKPVKTLFYMTVSTGIGGGVVDQGSIFLGAHGVAAEVGHITIDPSDSAALCQCGNKGCLEATASGTAIAKTAREWLAEGRFPGSLLAEGRETAVTAEAVFDAAAKGDPLAEQVLERAAQGLIIGLNNVVPLFNPDMIVLGGGVTVGLVESGLLSKIHQGVRDRAMSELHKEFQLVAAQLGDSVGLAGAAAMVWDQLDTTSG